MNLREIITEADILVPNEVPTADKVIWLNALNHDFFNVVKIPKMAWFDSVAGQNVYSLPADVRMKNTDMCMVGMIQYRSIQTEDVAPLQNSYMIDDETHTLVLTPAPYQSDMQGIVRYRRIATTTFSSATLAAAPDTPEEYHWTFIPGLCAFIANTQDDSVKAANYEAQYKAAWNVAAQNYQVGESI
ncbi:hypothetical protein J27TS7_58780 [Paenibacillus dendritiformis]|uniref:phage adaptor protein n=1 Tax=Paenibacillus dendritiformis TaxID=130049 RepID=UPI001B2BB55C|nr:hypothetical protein [Paenibacillus dendritiformis]GIO76364.1 hypothetical protein J27TS7_58780 [Paenibacillus dendritiformis]